jgi:hypothetical protein
MLFVIFAPNYKNEKNRKFNHRKEETESQKSRKFESKIPEFRREETFALDLLERLECPRRYHGLPEGKKTLCEAWPCAWNGTGLSVSALTIKSGRKNATLRVRWKKGAS